MRIVDVSVVLNISSLIVSRDGTGQQIQDQVGFRLSGNDKSGLFQAG